MCEVGAGSEMRVGVGVGAAFGRGGVVTVEMGAGPDSEAGAEIDDSMENLGGAAELLRMRSAVILSE